MATLHIDESDLEDVINRDWRHTVRHQGIYPAVAIAIAGLVFPISTHLSALAAGASLAWLWGLVLSLRDIRPRYVDYFASLKEPFTIEVLEGGLQFRGKPGESFVAWDAVSTYNYPGAFAIYDEDDMFALLPKRHLSSSEIIALEAKSKFRAGW